MYTIEIEKQNIPTDPWNIFNFGFLCAIPRKRLNIFFVDRDDDDDIRQLYRVATIRGHEIIADFLYQFQNDLDDWDGYGERLILAGVEMLYSYGHIDLSKKELTEMILKEYIPEKQAIIDKFKGNGFKYWLILDQNHWDQIPLETIK